MDLEEDPITSSKERREHDVRKGQMQVQCHQQTPTLASDNVSPELASWTLQNSDLSAHNFSKAMADPLDSLDVSASLASLISNAATDSQFSAPTTSEPTSAIERAKIKNRVAQKRFRDRQKAGRLGAYARHVCRLA